VEKERRPAAAEAGLAVADLQLFVNRRRDRDAKKEAVLRTAVRLFLERGYWHTSLNDVAEKLNITKPALYHYFHNKEEIYLECYRWGILLIKANLDCIRQQGGTGLQKVVNFIYCYAVIIAGDFGRCVVRQDDRELSAKARAEVRTYKRDIDRCLRSFIQEGMRDGSIREGDGKLSAFAIAGAVNSLALWFEPTGALTAAQVASNFAEILTQGIAKRRGEKLRVDEQLVRPTVPLKLVRKPARTKTGS
jgi:AcrR family transcriptional regulator